MNLVKIYTRITNKYTEKTGETADKFHMSP